MRTWTVRDVMTTAVVTVAEHAPYREVVDLLVGNRFSAVPVVDGSRRVTGVVSEADLLRKIEYAGAEAPRLFEGRRRRGERVKATGRTAGDLMSAPPVTVLAGTSLPAAARLMDAEGVKRLPVVDDGGRLVGIVSRGDLLKVHLRPDDEILADVPLRGGAAVPGRRRRPGAGHGRGRRGRPGRGRRPLVDDRHDIAERMTRQVAGVVEVVDELEYEYDDRAILGAGIAYGIA
ncbi:hypothetical protein GCM10020358_29520 [Amorphoplanes nipponensis]|uniref:CBS domain-containing protein n=1 Tax=Actinoplanes nipponensis TaxID=135950 RepID=UPI0031EDA786